MVAQAAHQQLLDEESHESSASRSQQEEHRNAVKKTDWICVATVPLCKRNQANAYSHRNCIPANNVELGNGAQEQHEKDKANEGQRRGPQEPSDMSNHVLHCLSFRECH